MEPIDRALKLSLVPGVTLAQACARTGVTLHALRRARKQLAIGRLGHDDLLLAALSCNGTEEEGELGDLAHLASWLDYVDKDGSTAASVAADLARLAAAGHLALSGSRYRLLRPWP